MIPIINITCCHNIVLLCCCCCCCVRLALALALSLSLSRSRSLALFLNAAVNIPQILRCTVVPYHPSYLLNAYEQPTPSPSMCTGENAPGLTIEFLYRPLPNYLRVCGCDCTCLCRCRRRGCPRLGVSPLFFWCRPSRTTSQVSSIQLKPS